LVGAIAGPSIARGFLLPEGPPGRAGLRARDRHHRRSRSARAGLGSSPFDDEGVRPERRALIDRRRAHHLAAEQRSARQLGLDTTGHASRGWPARRASRPTTCTWSPGRRTWPGLMRKAGHGPARHLHVRPFAERQHGRLVDRRLRRLVRRRRARLPRSRDHRAGNLRDLYARLVPGSDLEFRGASNAPSILIDAVAIAGR
jgi:PmbA protein